jgi:pyridoxal phosphate enzyme (YggS family)
MEAARRKPGDVALLAASKAQPADAIRALHAAGQSRFGENYVSEALAKMNALQLPDIEWHFIGPVQSNKTRQIATHFDWVHSVDREKIARRLSEQRDADREPLNVCLQINVSGEPTKSGVTLEDAPALARTIAGLAGLKLRGLMAIPAPTNDTELAQREFEKVTRLYDELLESGFQLDTLSMGMSADLEAAIAAGSTMVRVGTALFGPRA